MDVVAHLIGGFGTALQPLNLLVVFLGVLIRTIIGMLPGIGPINAIAILRVKITVKEFTASFWVMIRTSVSGFMVGVLPGAGATIASFLAYTTEQRLVDREGTFGKGDIRGVAAPEAANNASVSGALIPRLTLGVPGSGTTAVMLGALLALNLAPGPLFITRNADLFWGLIASMYIGNVMLLVLNLPLVGLFVRILLIPRWVLVPLVVAIAYVAVYSATSSSFDLFAMTAFGVLGFFMKKLGFPLAPVVLAVVLGPMMEVNLRCALSLSNNDGSVLYGSPIAIALWAMTAFSLLLPLLLRRRKPAVTTVVQETDGEK